MRFIPTAPFLLAPLLLFATAVRAAPDDPPANGEGSVMFTPAAKPHFPRLGPQPSGSLGIGNEPRSSSRYGIGYDARHGVNAEAQSHRGNSRAHPERPGRAEQSGRGR